MSPVFNSQVTSNSPLVSINQGDVVLATLFSNEIPVAGASSIAVAVAPRTASGGPPLVSFQFECPGGIGAGVFQIQESDGPLGTEDGNFTSVNFGGASPGQVVAANMNAAGTARVELQLATRFVRVKCITAPGAVITVRVGQK